MLGVDASTEVLRVAESHKRTDPALSGRLRYINATIDSLGEELAKGGEGAGQFDIVCIPSPAGFHSDSNERNR